jgi:hypothetical protein
VRVVRLNVAEGLVVQTINESAAPAAAAGWVPFRPMTRQSIIANARTMYRLDGL